MNIRIDQMADMDFHTVVPPGSFRVSIWIDDPTDKLVIIKDAVSITVEGRAKFTFAEFLMLAQAINETLK